MTRKDFRVIVTAFRMCKPDKEYYEADVYARYLKQWRYSVDVVAAYLATTNPRFDRQRFLTACEYDI